MSLPSIPINNVPPGGTTPSTPSQFLMSTLSKIRQDTDYVAPVYEPPPVFRFVGTTLDRTSGADGTDILAFVDASEQGQTQRDAQVQYVKSLTGLGIFFIVFCALWFLTIWLLKCQGRQRVGCAAGYAFHDRDDDTETIVDERRQRQAKDRAQHKLTWSPDEDVSIGAAYDGGDGSVMDDNNVERSNHNNHTDYDADYEARKRKQQQQKRQPRDDDDSDTGVGPGVTARTAITAFVLGRSYRSPNTTNKNKNNDPQQQQSNVAKRNDHRHKPKYVNDDDDDDNSSFGNPWSVSIDPSSNNDQNSHMYRYNDDMSAIDVMLEAGSRYEHDYDNRSEYEPRGRHSERRQQQKQKKQQKKQQYTLRSLPKHSTRTTNTRTSSSWIPSAFGGDNDSTSSSVVSDTETFSPRSSSPRNQSSSSNNFSGWCSSCSWFNGCCSWDPDHVRRRKYRTRFAYGFFSLVALVCCVLLMLVMYAPLEQSAQTTSDVVVEAKTIVNDVNNVLTVLDNAATTTQTILETQLLTDYTTLCPGVTINEFQSVFGFNPDTIITTVRAEYERYGSQAVQLLETASTAVDQVTDVLEGVNGAVSTTNDYLWVVPLLICLTALVIFATTGLMGFVVWRERTIELNKSVPKIENWYGWTFLPLLVITCIVSWALVIACCFGTVVTTDTCVSSTSPDQTVLTILESQNLDEDIYQRLSTYINGCEGPDPLQELVVLQSLLQETLGFVNERVVLAETIGFTALEEQCGVGNSVRSFFEDVTTLQNEVINVNEAMQTAYEALECPRINTLYTQVAHDALCTDFATANVNGFLLFLFGPAISGLVLISLRASWRTSA